MRAKGRVALTVVWGRLIERNSDVVIDDWSLELEVRLSEDEGRAILGSLWSDVFRDDLLCCAGMLNDRRGEGGVVGA